MSSIPGLPPTGLDVTVVVARVNLNPHCVLVELWTNFNQEREADYRCMESTIQCPGQLFRKFDGNPGDNCLAKIDDSWYRSRIVSGNGTNYRVFLIDKGWTLGATTNMLAWGEKDYFLLPPEVEFCVLSNVLPLSPDNRWSPMALEFLKSLSGRTVRAVVQDVLVPQRTFLLHIACIAKQMQEMGFAKCLSPHKFKDFVLKSVNSDNRMALLPAPPQQATAKKPLYKEELIDQQQSFMYPELSTGTVETVIITEVTNPLRVFCQLKVFSQELKKVTAKITQHYEGRATSFLGPHSLGSPCAARGSDGQWYRSVLQQIFPANNAVEVFNVDTGKKQFVLVDNVKPLAAEFFRMPVVTYIASLHGIIDKGVGWTTSQVDYLRSLILDKTVIAKFEYQSHSEGVHYVTLYGEDNKNMNTSFGSTEHCLLDGKNLPVNYAVDSSLVKTNDQSPHEIQGDIQTSAKAVKLFGRPMPRDNVPVEDLPLGSSHVAVVLHISSPSKFWIQMQKYAIEFDHLMDGISEIYKDPVNQNKVKNPTVGLYCAVRLHDGIIYRSRVVEVSETKIKVFLVDYGKMEVVDWGSICTLPDKFRELPQLSLECKLAGVKPRNKTWIRTDVDFFTRSVNDKLLNAQVITKYDGGYTVRLTDSVAHGEKDVAKLMCSYEFAMQDDTESGPHHRLASPHTSIPVALDSGTTHLGVNSSSFCDFQMKSPVEPNNNDIQPSTFKEQMFPIGSTLEVNVCCIESPNNFWCQLIRNMTPLKLLMQDMQAYYSESQFYPFVEKACVARHPDNGMWYRAIVIQKHSTPHVDVLFIDYGQMKAAVPLHDLRKICPAFLTLKGQAFRCSLYNPEEPSLPMKDWNQEARAQFKEFVETAVFKHVDLKCTVYTVMYSDQKVLYNVVDLETPFESVCTRMLKLSKNPPPKKIPGLSYRLYTYCYSAHNIKTGTEEMMTVTSVDNANQFYCQLDRNVNVVENLTMKLHNLCGQLKNAKLPTLFGTVCFAKYPDGHWYRGLIKTTQPSVSVFFVDYGDTLEVDKADILPVPLEATDIMSVPVQAIKCGLADIPADVQSEVNSWFKTNATDNSFRALVVAKEPCGKLLVELYHGTSQLNSEIRKTFLKAPPKCIPELKDDQQPVPYPKVSSVPSCSENGSSQRINEKSKPHPLELYKTPHQRKMPRRISGAEQRTDPVDTYTSQQIKPYAPVQQQQLHVSKLHCTESQQSKVVLEPKKRVPTPDTDQSEKSKTLVVEAESLRYLLPHFSQGQKLEAYVATVTGPHTFWCQPADSKELDRITLGVSEVANAAHDPVNPKLLSRGSPCVALFTDDEQWYRAEVISMDGNKLSAHFVDYGNDSKVDIKHVREIPPELVKIQAQAFLCELDGFEDANGSWKDGAVDHIAGIMTDKVLELTVVKILRKDNDEIRCIVQVLCEGNMVNTMARAYWIISQTSKYLDSTGLSAVHPTSLPCGSSDKDTSMQRSQIEAEEPQHHTREELEYLRDPTDEQCTIDLDKSKEPSIYSKMDMASTLRSVSVGQTTCSLQSDSAVDEEVSVVSESQPEDGAAPASEDTESCQMEYLSTGKSVVKRDQDCEHYITQIDHHDAGPDYCCLEATPASVELDLDSEFGRLRVAEALPVGAMCIIWSHTAQRWCQARILKYLKDCTMVILVNEEKEMMVDPASIFESIGPQSDQLDDNNNQHSDNQLVSAHETLAVFSTAEQSDDSEDTLVAVEGLSLDENFETAVKDFTRPSEACPLTLPEEEPSVRVEVQLAPKEEEEEEGLVVPIEEEALSMLQKDVLIPSTQEEVLKPSTQEEVLMPSTGEAMQSPPTEEEVQIPSTQEEVLKPSTQEEVLMPSIGEEVQIPSTQEEAMQSPPTEEEEVLIPELMSTHEQIPSTEQGLSPLTETEDVLLPLTDKVLLMPSSKEEVQIPSTQELQTGLLQEKVQISPLLEEMGLLPSSEQELHITWRQEDVAACLHQQLVIEEEPSQFVEEHCVLSDSSESAADGRPNPLQEMVARGLRLDDEEQVTTDLQPCAVAHHDVEDLLDMEEQSLEAHLSSVTHLSLVINDNTDDLIVFIDEVRPPNQQK